MSVCGRPIRGGLARAGLLVACVSCAAPSEQMDVDGLPLTWNNVFARAGGVRQVALAPDAETLALVDGNGLRLTTLGASPDEALGDSALPGGQPAWSPDGTRLAWVEDGQLLVAEASGGLLENGRPVGGPLAGLRRPSWSPQGDRIAVFALAPAPAVAAQGGEEGGADARAGAASGDQFQDLFVVNVADGEQSWQRVTTGAAEGDDARFVPQWSPDGRWLAYVSNEADWWHDDVWLVELATGRRTRISSRLMASSSPVWVPPAAGQPFDESRAGLVLMATSKDGYWYQDLADLWHLEVDLRTGAPRLLREEPIEMQVHATDWIMRFDPFLVANQQGTRVFFPYHQRGAFELWSVPLEGGVATRVTNVGGAWSALSASANGDAAVFVRDAPAEGREAWAIDLRTGGPARPVTAASPGFAGVQKPREISFRTFDGHYLQGFLYLPTALRSDPAAGPCPALVQVHGGGTNSYYQGSNLVEQALADRGFVVLAINYRGGSGFGRGFQDLAIEDWLNDQSKDPGAAADWLRAQPWSNGRVGIYGGSYGGMQSMSAITRTPDKFDAAVPMRGIYSESLTLADADRLGTIFTVTGHGGTPEERPEIYAKSETLDRLDRITAPVLLMHGELDVRAPYRNFELAVEKLEALGKEFEAKSYPDEGHGFRDPANLADMYSRLEQWFANHLGQPCG